jgi:hypothetical protein
MVVLYLLEHYQKLICGGNHPFVHLVGKRQENNFLLMRLIDFTNADVGDTVIVEKTLHHGFLRVGGRYLVTATSIEWIEGDEGDGHEIYSLKVNGCWIDEDVDDCVNVFT